MQETERKVSTERAATDKVTTTTTTMQIPTKPTQKVINNVYTTIKTTRKPTKSTKKYQIKTESTTTTKKPDRIKTRQTKPIRIPKKQKGIENSSQAESCKDSFSVLGSLTCVELFQRYAFHYCKRNRVIKKKCCKTYRKACNVPR